MEPLKVGVHGALGLLAAACALYNGAAWLERREAHLALNSVLYTIVALFEGTRCADHLSEMR